MTLFAPDILDAARGLSPAVCVAGLLAGSLLWLLGWRGHRFWIVVATTVTAGILGLYAEPLHGMQPLVAAVLLAIAAGVMALALARLVAFASGGVAGWLLVHALVPNWNEPLICFVAGGLLGVYLFRLWTMALTSLGGTLLVGYSGLCLLDRLGKVDAVALAEARPHLLNAACVAVAILGVVVQFSSEHRRAAREKAIAEREQQHKTQQEMERTYKAVQQQEKTWLGWVKKHYRKAG